VGRGRACKFQEGPVSLLRRSLQRIGAAVSVHARCGTDERELQKWLVSTSSACSFDQPMLLCHLWKSGGRNKERDSVMSPNFSPSSGKKIVRYLHTHTSLHVIWGPGRQRSSFARHDQGARKAGLPMVSSRRARTWAGNPLWTEEHNRITTSEQDPGVKSRKNGKAGWPWLMGGPPADQRSPDFKSGRKLQPAEAKEQQLSSLVNLTEIGCRDPGMVLGGEAA